jgi:signal transduction histidine kinase
LRYLVSTTYATIRRKIKKFLNLSNVLAACFSEETVNLEIVSEDSNLIALCREVAREFSLITWRIRTQPDSLEVSNADFCLWDYKPGNRIPEHACWGARCFVLVSSRDLSNFQMDHPYAEAGIILKPVTPAIVRALFAQTAVGSTRHLRSENDSIRSDRDDILQCLMQANLRLQQYDAERTNFIGRALHDFHAPLTALSGYCGLLLEGKCGLLNEQQKLIINRMQHSVRRLARMSRAMFQLSVGRHVPQKSVLRKADIRECAEQALYEIQQLAQEKELQLDVNLEPPTVPLWMDSGQIEQVMINLLENACKFSPRGGIVTVHGYSCFIERRAQNVICPAQSDRRTRDIRIPNVYRIDIIDSGPGIATEHLSAIFEEYVSYSGGQDRSRGGLGLAICRMILNQHQGRIWAENCDSGAVFSFILPLQQVDQSQRSTDMICASAAREGESFAACL